MKHEFEAAWIPPHVDLSPEEAAAIAMDWADARAVNRQLPAVLVSDLKGAYHGDAPFNRYRNGRHITPPSGHVGFPVGAVVAFNPTSAALEIAMKAAHGNSLAVVALTPGTWWLHGWAGAVGARDLLTGEIASLDPRLVDHLRQMIQFGNNGYTRGFGRDVAERVLHEIQSQDLLDHDVAVSALGGLGMPARHQEVISKLIDKMVPAGSGRDRMRV
jgi:hypothetical protein